MQHITPDTNLDELTDEQRLELAQSLRDEQMREQPLISHVEPFEMLEAEYQENPAFLAKIRWLKHNAHFVGIRRARGDGDCFYRAFAFAFIQKILLMNDRPLHHFVVKHVEGTLALLKQAGFEESVYQDFYEPLRKLLLRMHSTDPETQELNEALLVEALNDPETSNSIVVYLRLLASAFLKLNADEYTPFLFALDDVARRGAPPTMDEFCANQVEPIGREADHVQITALSRALKTGLDVVYLSRAHAPPETPLSEDFPLDVGAAAERTGADLAQPTEVPGADAEARRRANDDPDRCDVVRFDVEEGQMLEIGTLLLRPGHYDLLVEAPPPASPEIEIPPAAKPL
ncbi:hypothetical protein ACQY0O_001439 [Thecaphora frezii]